jgi:hypothetical protein
MAHRIGFCISLALLSSLACTGSELTPAGHRVVYSTSPLDVSGCAKLGDVAAGGVSNPHDPQQRIIAQHELRNATAEKGGTHVLVDESATPGLAQGVAYKCP